MRVGCGRPAPGVRLCPGALARPAPLPIPWLHLSSQLSPPRPTPPTSSAPALATIFY